MEQNWTEIFGCMALYVNGHLLIYKNMKAYKMPGGESAVSWMVMGQDDDHLLVSPDGFNVSAINKSLCEIV